MSAVEMLLASLTVALCGAVGALTRRRSRPAPTGGQAPAISRDFLQTIYHELRSPVTSVAALARACAHLDRLDTAGRKEALDLIQRHAEQLTAILDDVREVADCLAARQAALGTCSLQEVVRTSAACAGLPPERVEVELADDAVFVSTSVSALSRILTNLLQNAARYGPPGGMVLVRSRRCARARRTEVSVLDGGNGPGSEAQPRPAEALGLGSRLVDELAGSLGGAVVRQRTPIGYAVAVQLPHDAIGPERPPAGP